MALPWVRLDTAWPQNPKFLMLAEDKRWRAGFVYFAGLAWSGAQGQNGYIPVTALAMIHGTRKEADQLVEVALWVPAQGGWDINDWATYQGMGLKTHEQRSEVGRQNAMKRWHRDANGNANRMPDAYA